MPRRATQDDAPGVADTWLRSRHASVPAIPPTVHSDDEVRTWFAEVVLPSRETWVVDGDDGTVAALMVLKAGWVDQLHVAPEREGQGLGSLLIEIAKERYPDGLDLWTFQSNTGARRFYDRHGFVEVAWTDGENEEGEPDVRFHLEP